MTALIVAIVPLIAVGLTFVIPRDRFALYLAMLVAAVNFALANVLVNEPTVSSLNAFAGYVICDPSSRVFLLVISAVFFGIVLYVYNRVGTAPESKVGIGRFVRLSLLCYSALVLSILSGHFLLTSVALEISTLAAAPLVYHQRGAVAYRAAWRYLLFSTVSLALALLGFLVIAHGVEAGAQATEGVFFLQKWAAQPFKVGSPWLEIGVFLILFGYCSKLGLAPWYSWLPETYDAAPPSVTTLLAAMQFNCVLLALFRVVPVFLPLAPGLIRVELVLLGLASMSLAAIHIVTEKNYKRLIAYASINHAGVIAIGLGVGKAAGFGVVLYVISNALVKSILFLTCGNIKAQYRTKQVDGIHGLIKQMPFSGAFFMVGVFALLGFAPFGSFIGEVIIMSSMIDQKLYALFTVFCLILTIIFVAMGRSVFPMIWGQPKVEAQSKSETIYTLLPNFFFIFLLVAMGVYIPTSVSQMLRAVSVSLGGP